MADRLISADKLFMFVQDSKHTILIVGILSELCMTTSMRRFLRMIFHAPTVDAVEVVRCKDCENRHSSEFCECRPPDAFCSDGIKGGSGNA